MIILWIISIVALLLGLWSVYAVTLIYKTLDTQNGINNLNKEALLNLIETITDVKPEDVANENAATESEEKVEE